MIRRNGICSVAALGALALGSAAVGQEITPDQFISADAERQIVVTAEDDPEPETSEVKVQARSITHASNIFDEPLALFQKPLCPGVTGLPVELATLIADRIRYNAERVGLDLADGGSCSANMIVSFVIDGQKALQDISAAGNSLLAKIPVSEKTALLRDDGPVHAWLVVALASRDGMPVSQDPRQLYQVVNSQSANSRILLVSRKEIEIAAVVIDVGAIDGMSAVQIADYATMRGLAKTRPVEGNATYSTILNLFDENASHAAELTAFDLAYLKTLYERPPNIIAAAKLGTIGGQMRDEVAAAEAVEASLSE